MNKKIINQHSSTKCSLCNKSATNVVTDQESNEIICVNCGSVINPIIQEVRIQSTPPNIAVESAAKSERGSAVLSRHDKGLYTIIGKTDRDASGHKIDLEMRNRIGRWRILDTRSQRTNQKERNLLSAFIYLQGLKDQLGLPDVVIEKAAYIYRKIRERIFTKGTSIKLVITAALYIACRELMVPRTLKEIAEISDMDEKKLARLYRAILFELDLKVPQTDPFKMIIKIANLCKISEKTKRYSIKLMNELINKRLFTSKDPMGMAGAIVYMASRRNGEHIIQYQIANATGVTIIT